MWIRTSPIKTVIYSWKCQLISVRPERVHARNHARVTIPIVQRKQVTMITRNQLLMIRWIRKNSIKIAHNTNKIIVLNRTNISNWLLLRNQRSTLILSTKGITLSELIKWRGRLRCAEIGRSVENVNSKINAPSLMVSMSWLKRHICLRTSKLRYAHNFTLQLTALMAIDANFCTLNSTFFIRKISATKLY